MKTKAELKADHFKSLHNVTYGGAARYKLEDKHAELLIEHGYVKQGLGGLIPTHAGRFALARRGYP